MPIQLETMSHINRALKCLPGTICISGDYTSKDIEHIVAEIDTEVVNDCADYDKENIVLLNGFDALSFDEKLQVQQNIIDGQVRYLIFDNKASMSVALVNELLCIHVGI